MPEILIPAQSTFDWLTVPYVHDASLPSHIQDVLLDGMIVRSIALSDYLAGKLTYDEYLQALDQTGIDALDFHDTLEDGQCYL